MKLFRNNRGETIAETIIALSILAVGITIASSISASSLRNISSSKNRVIAVNIAREGIEAVRNIRDTNWLKYGNKKRQCWNHLPIDYDTGIGSPIPPCDPTVPTALIEPGTYIVYKSGNNESPPNRRWRLEAVAAPTDPIQAEYNLGLIDIDTAGVDSDNDTNFANDEDTYNHITPGDALGTSGLPGVNDTALVTTSPFSRIITIEYLANSGTLLPTTGSLSGHLDPHNRMVVTSRVQWIQGPNLFNTELKTVLTDYLDRENLND